MCFQSTNAIAYQSFSLNAIVNTLHAVQYVHIWSIKSFRTGPFQHLNYSSFPSYFLFACCPSSLFPLFL